MRAHIDRTKHILGFDKMLGEKKVQLNEKEWDLALRGGGGVTPTEAQAPVSTPETTGRS
jgi:hypothetical protein